MIRRLTRRLADLRAVRAPRNAAERLRRVPWPAGTRPGVAVVAVNYETRELISHLVFSLYRILGGDQFSRLVVVDNASRDGSREQLQTLHDAGLLHLIANTRQRYHGPALNQALSWLARHDPREYVWVLDSDVIVLRRDALSGALGAIRGNALAGQKLPDHVPLSCLLLDPRLVWQRGIPPFHDDGAPSEALQREVVRRGLGIADFPFGTGTYALHLGGATLDAIAERGDDGNRFYGWALQQAGVTYSRHPLGPHLHRTFLELYERELAAAGGSLAAACRGALIEIPDARPLPPLEELAALSARGVDLERHLLAQLRDR